MTDSPCWDQPLESFAEGVPTKTRDFWGSICHEIKIIRDPFEERVIDLFEGISIRFETQVKLLQTSLTHSMVE